MRLYHHYFRVNYKNYNSVLCGKYRNSWHNVSFTSVYIIVDIGFSL